MVNVMGVPVVTGVVTELADDDGDSVTAEKKKKISIHRCSLAHVACQAEEYRHW